MDILLANWPLVLSLLGAGLFAGLAAGLFGIGGGAVIVPVLIILFEDVLGFTETGSHVAIGTSLADHHPDICAVCSCA